MCGRKDPENRWVLLCPRPALHQWSPASCFLSTHSETPESLSSLRKLRGDKCRWLCLNETRFGWNWPIISSVIGNFHIGKIPSRSVCVTLATKQKLKLCWLLGFERFCQSSTYFKLEVLSIKLEVKPSSCIVIFLYAYMIFLLHLC